MIVLSKRPVKRYKIRFDGDVADTAGNDHSEIDDTGMLLAQFKRNGWTGLCSRKFYAPAPARRSPNRCTTRR